MRYWDSSALVPLFLEEETSKKVEALLDKDSTVVSWWSTPVECLSALCRLRKERIFTESVFRQAKNDFDELMAEIDLVPPSKGLRDRALRLLSTHTLRAGDALQLAAALQSVQEKTAGAGFVSLDERLRDAALREGFDLLP